MKKFICALLSLAMLALFAGCHNRKNIETDTTDASSGSVEAQVEDTSAASPDSTAPQANSESASVEDTSAASPNSTAPQADSKSASVEETKADAPANGTTAAPSEQPSVSVGKFSFIKDKKGDILRADSESKIWAGVVGDAYILLRNTSDANEWGEKGRVYELHCAQFAGKYSMWSDGYWEINDDGTELTLTPKNQSENGSIGVAAGKSKTFKGQNGVFSVPVTFEQGGKTTVKIDFNKVSK